MARSQTVCATLVSPKQPNLCRDNQAISQIPTPDTVSLINSLDNRICNIRTRASLQPSSAQPLCVPTCRTSLRISVTLEHAGLFLASCQAHILGTQYSTSQSVKKRHRHTLHARPSYTSDPGARFSDKKQKTEQNIFPSSHVGQAIASPNKQRSTQAPKKKHIDSTHAPPRHTAVRAIY